jgi:DNA-binding Xre family transcriptional regulator
MIENIESKPRTKLYKILRKKGINQTGLHNLIKDRCKSSLGNDVISRIVNGKKTNYEIHTLLKICIALDCTPNDIIEKEYFMSTQVLDEYK